MKNIKISKIEIENFKGIRRLTLDLNGRSASLYGDNATGKTTVYDALTWLLFGKDSHDNTKFSIKPLLKVTFTNLEKSEVLVFLNGSTWVM